ncbi:carbohydrate ABC transporter permease [Breznakiella homolactica]|uniref:Carbohydrate ABC transporter permease n=1 Tax=Breznakiella homolactica TaxID=2798577 RepID=A0A7T8BCB7_9SPIR|nr:carbohydrate ABC transporter permease [Breznakiella homolactica]QQO10083.1 carbohydrate ABC transporter permease [Breznakiella homolactica]
MKKSNIRNARIKTAMVYIVSLIGIVWSLFPIYWMLKSSLTPNSEMYGINPSLLPSKITLEHYKQLFTQTVFMRYFLNSLYVAVFSTVVALVLSILASYAMTRLNFRGRNFMRKSVLFAYLLPTAVLFIPMYIMISRIGLGDNKNSLIIVYQTFIIPYCCYMLMSYFTAIPKSMEEAAFIDGCSHLQALMKIVLPIAAPSIAVVATFAFTLSWNEYLYALVLTTSASQQTVTIGISGFRYSDNYIWGLIMCSSVIASIPAVVLYMMAQRFMVSGLAAGGVKQ